ncbi:MAG: SOS response-associated peptidase [Tissierellaceae bacterium]|nr:SOS response-associated peptidase [Tissierellaceae bacterium]
MCGRFMLDSDVEEIIKQYKILKREATDFKKGDIYPSQNAPIVMDDKGRTLKLSKWGFPFSGNSKLVINARSESIGTKSMFMQSFLSSRCIVPANLFYEWKDEGNKRKAKHEIYLPEEKILSLGGIVKLVADEKGNKDLSFVIITTESNKYMKDLHPRMPLIIENETLDYWLDNSTTQRTIDEIVKLNMSHELKIERVEKEEPFEQMKLF